MDFLRLTDLTRNDVRNIFTIADGLENGEYRGFLSGKTVVMFFPASSIRTRVSFEKGVYLLGGQTILFPMETLDKKEDLRDVCGYLGNWADAVIVRHKDIGVLEKMAEHSPFPVINAMTDINHPCEILSDMYTLSKRRADFTKDKYLFCGICGNIGLAWKEAADLMGLDLVQCCGRGYEMEGVPVYYSISEAVCGRDIVCTDSLPEKCLADFRNCQVTKAVMDMANEGALLVPCPPFFRGEEVSADVIDSGYFAGYDAKKYLLTIQQAVIIYTLKGGTL